MKDSQLSPHLKYSMMLYCQNIDIFSIDIPTKVRSVHENDQYVQSWNPTTNFSKIAKIQEKSEIGKKDKSILMYVDNYFFVGPLFT